MTSSGTLVSAQPRTPSVSEDRCDGCSAAAKLRITMTGGGELSFCGHHGNRYAEDLVKLTAQYTTDPEFTWRGADMLPKT